MPGAVWCRYQKQLAPRGVFRESGVARRGDREVARKSRAVDLYINGG